MRLLLVRHGETASNIERKLDTAMPGPPLTELGHKQARELADTLGAEDLVAVYASIGLRAQQTAQPTAERFGLPVQVLEGIEEIQVGSLEGRNDTEAYQTYLQTVIRWAEGALDVAFPGGGESGQQVLDRFLGAIESIRQDGTVMVVTHGGAGRMGRWRWRRTCRWSWRRTCCRTPGSWCWRPRATAGCAGRGPASRSSPSPVRAAWRRPPRSGARSRAPR